MNEVHIGSATVLLTFIACGLTCALFALIPALQASRANPHDAMQDAGRTTTAGSSRQRIRQFLVVGQVGIAAMLIIGSALLIASFQNLRNVDPGFDPERLMTLGLSLPSASYSNPARISGFADELLAKANALPSVESAALAYDHPLEGNWVDIFSIVNRPTEPGRDSPSGYFKIVSDGYFKTAGVLLVRGRLFDSFDNRTAKGVVIINQAFADRFLSGEDPVGQSLDIRTPRAIWGSAVPDRFEIVGIVRNTRFLGMRQDPAPAFYVPFGQCPNGAFTVLVKGRQDPEPIVPAIRSLVWSIDPNQPISETLSMDTIIDRDLARPRFNMFLMTVFGMVALILSSVGIYGLLAYLVSQRKQEIGIRVALGAGTNDIFTMVIGQGLKLALTGLLLGLAGALAMTGLLQKLLFGVSPRDPAIFAAAAGFLGMVILLASAIPALRATRVDPGITLKGE